jgi:hypothetical protein
MFHPRLKRGRRPERRIVCFRAILLKNSKIRERRNFRRDPFIADKRTSASATLMASHSSEDRTGTVWRLPELAQDFLASKQGCIAASKAA